MTSGTRAPVVGPVALLAHPAVRLFLTSAALLFVELFLIRWIPANVVYVGNFKNFLLMGSFLGIGLGILLGRAGPSRLPVASFPLLFFAVVKAVSVVQLNINLGSPDEILLGGTSFARAAADADGTVMVAVVALTTVVMAALATPLGGLLRSMPPLRAYAVDIVGSLFGIALFTVLSGLSTGPFVWTVVVGTFAVLLGLARGITAWSAVSAAAVVASIYTAALQTDTWSPYQRITVFELPDQVAISVNGVNQQSFKRDREEIGFYYGQVDEWFPGRTYDNVLVIGAGNGNDVAKILERNPRHVDAVEIDPELLAIGRRLHPARPYDDPRVSVHVDDGRAFLSRSRDKYDLIVFALPDSLTLVSTTANLRLESFLFTEEAFASVRDHLAPSGLFTMYNFYWQDWYVERMAATMAAAFGHEPIVRVYDELGGSAAVLAAGPAVAELKGGPPPGGMVDDLASTGPQRATDDWPFPHLRDPSIAPYYVVALALVLLFALALVASSARAARVSLTRFSPHFFVLGIAFLLLETRSIVTFSLLFGNTWSVNALVFFAVLVSVLAAIGVNARFPIRNHRLLYLALFGSIAIAFVLPPASLLVDPPWLRYLLASTLAFAPVFFANLVFTHSFRDTRTADMAFASNLLGAMVGGALEYIALVSGYQALLLVVGILYAAAYVLATRVRVLADGELGTRSIPAVPAGAGAAPG